MLIGTEIVRKKNDIGTEIVRRQFIFGVDILEVILKDGKYTSKELCELCKYDYNNFRKRKTLIDKLNFL